VERRTSDLPPQVAIRETISKARREDPGQVRAPDGAAPASTEPSSTCPQAPRRLRSSSTDRRRQDPEEYINADRRGHPRGDGARPYWPLPLVDFKVELIDGRTTSRFERAARSKIAGLLAFKESDEAAKPKLLEPTMRSK